MLDTARRTRGKRSGVTRRVDVKQNLSKTNPHTQETHEHARKRKCPQTHTSTYIVYYIHIYLYTCVCVCAPIQHVYCRQNVIIKEFQNRLVGAMRTWTLGCERRRMCVCVCARPKCASSENIIRICAVDIYTRLNTHTHTNSAVFRPQVKCNILLRKAPGRPLCIPCWSQ